MYLKRLELQGFKSFADKTIIDFEKGITGVVGPNGSGKSNISDSIRWVLGEQSAKTLRGAKMEDIIFAGTTRRRPVGYAEITLVLDNKDGKMAIDYSEVSVTRRVFRSGESEYYLNRTQCRLKDIKELFMDTGVGIDGYSIIGQGRIDTILSSKSEDRRVLFEEAAGIVKYKTRKQESEKKLEKTKENLIRINDIIRELNNQIEPLKNQSQKAKEYVKLSENLKQLEVNLFIREISRLNKQIGIIESQKKLVEKQIKFNDEKKNEIENNFNVIKNEIEKMNTDLEKIQEQKYNAKNEIEKIEGETKLSNEKISFMKKEISRFENEIDELNSNNKKMKTEKEDLYFSKDHLSKDLREMKDKYEEKVSFLNDLNESLLDCEEKIEKEKSTIIQILNSIAEKKSKINTIESFNINIRKRIEQLESEVKLLISSEGEKDSQIDKNRDYILSLENKITELSILKTKKINHKKENLELYEKTNADINVIKGDIQGKTSKRNLLIDMKNEYEGYYKSVKYALGFSKKYNDIGKGVKGVVAELINVKKDYEIAIEVSLGSTLQNIVTETEYDAKKIINYLKSNSLGRVTFLPKSSINSRHIRNQEKEILNIKGVIGVASELIEYDLEYKNIFRNLLGRVIIVDNLDTGIKAAKMCNNSLKIVTLEGDVLNSGGSITGGSYNSRNTNLLGRDRNIEELTKSISELNGQCKYLEGELSLYQKIVLETENEIKNIEENINNTSLLKAKQDNKMLNDIEERKKIVKNIDKTVNEKNHLLNENSDSDKNVILLESDIENLSNKKQDIQNNINDLVKDYESVKNNKAKIEESITDIRIKISSHEQQIKTIDLSLDKFDEDKKRKNEILESKKEEYDNCKKQLVILNEQIEKLNKNKLLADDKLIKYEVNSEEIKFKKKKMLTDFTDEEKNIRILSSKINDLSRSLNTLEIKFAKYSIQLENYNNKLWEDYELSFQMALKYKIDIDNITKVQNEIRTIKNTIRNLGNINVDSIEEYESVLERYNFMNEQNEDLLKGKESLNKVIKDMENKMKDQFLSNFYVIKENFSEVFSQLFGGGKADIYLDDEENILTTGIEIIAQPPGKKLQNISLLSGGEKALTAIALLFSILKLKPTPFCVLDEIEAALDDANVYRFADYLMEFSQETQFIVITHRKGTMESVDSLYGVTMEEEGVSKIVSVKLSDNITNKVS